MRKGLVTTKRNEHPEEMHGEMGDWVFLEREQFLNAQDKAFVHTLHKPVQRTAISCTRVVCKEFWSFSYAFATHLSKAAQELTVLDTLPD